MSPARWWRGLASVMGWGVVAAGGGRGRKSTAAASRQRLATPRWPDGVGHARREMRRGAPAGRWSAVGSAGVSGAAAVVDQCGNRAGSSAGKIDR